MFTARQQTLLCGVESLSVIAYCLAWEIPHVEVGRAGRPRKNPVALVCGLARAVGPICPVAEVIIMCVADIEVSRL